MGEKSLSELQMIQEAGGSRKTRGCDSRKKQYSIFKDLSAIDGQVAPQGGRDKGFRERGAKFRCNSGRLKSLREQRGKIKRIQSKASGFSEGLTDETSNDSDENRSTDI